MKPKKGCLSTLSRNQNPWCPPQITATNPEEEREREREKYGEDHFQLKDRSANAVSNKLNKSWHENSPVNSSFHMRFKSKHKTGE